MMTIIRLLDPKTGEEIIVRRYTAPNLQGWTGRTSQWYLELMLRS
jgi:hypothetical protein